MFSVLQQHCICLVTGYTFYCTHQPMKLLHLVTSIPYIFHLQFVFSVSYTKIKCLCSVRTAGTRRLLHVYRHFLKQLLSHKWSTWCKSFGSGMKLPFESMFSTQFCYSGRGLEMAHHSFLKEVWCDTNFYNTVLKHFGFSCFCCLFFQLVRWSNGM